MPQSRGHRSKLGFSRRCVALVLVSGPCHPGRRVVELICSGYRAITDPISNATSAALNEYLGSQGLTDELRASFIAFGQRTKDTLISIINSKLQYLNSIPYKFVGILSHILDSYDIENSRRVCRECLAERDAAVTAGRAGRLHRVVAILAMGSDNQCRIDLESFARGGPLGPYAMAELMHYAMASLVTRRVEAVHSQILHHCKRATYHLPSLINARVKRAELTAALESPSFFGFAVANYRKRNLARDLLKFTMAPKKQWLVQVMPLHELKGHIFLFSPAAQHRDLCAEKKATAEIIKTTAASRKPVLQDLLAMSSWVVSFMKESFEMVPGSLWSLPSAALRRSAPAALVASVRDLAASIAGAIQNETLLSAEFRHLVFFRVLQAKPEAKKYVTLAHTEVHRSIVEVRTYDMVGFDHGSGVVLRPGAAMQIDLALLCTVADISSLWRWAVVVNRPCAQLDRRALLGIEASEALQDDTLPYGQEAPPPLASLAQQALHTLVSAQKAVVDPSSPPEIMDDGTQDVSGDVPDCGSVLASSLDFFDGPAFDLLVRSGVVVRSTDSFGELLLRVEPQRCLWSLESIASEPEMAWHVAEPGCTASRLHCWVSLLKVGWELSDDFVGTYTQRSPKRLHKSILSRPMSCLCALLDFNNIVVTKGAGQICMGMPDPYYKALLNLECLRGFHEQENFALFGNKEFRLLAAGKTVGQLSAGGEDEQLAIEDGEPDGAVGSLDAPAPSAPLAPLDADAESWDRPPIAFRGGLRIYFDNATHSSGVRRAFACCRHVDHGRCDKYVFLTAFPDEESAASWLAAWERLSERTNDHHEHLAMVPSDDEVAQARAKLIGRV